MKYFNLILFLGLILVACKSKEKPAADSAMSAAPATPAAPVIDSTHMAKLSDEEKANGWQLLFDGLSTKGWHKYGADAPGQAWKVVEGSLMLDARNKADWQAQGGGDLVTDGEFENFHLKLDWKIDTCGNSGIIFFVQEDTAMYKYAWHTGPEMQVLDNTCHPDAKIKKHRAGDLYDLISSSKETVKPALEWNQAEIVSQAGVLDFYLNGEKVVSTNVTDAKWKRLVNGSKFKTMPGFAAIARGSISLQDHGNTVWFRNIKIKSL